MHANACYFSVKVVFANVQLALSSPKTIQDKYGFRAALKSRIEIGFSFWKHQHASRNYAEAS